MSSGVNAAELSYRTLHMELNRPERRISDVPGGLINMLSTMDTKQITIENGDQP